MQTVVETPTYLAIANQLFSEEERADIVAAYSAATGISVDEEELTWWNVFSCWKLAVIVLTGVHAFVDGTFDRVHQSPTWLVRAMLRMIASGEAR